MRTRPRSLAPLVLALVLLVPPGARAGAQALTIPEYRELLLSKEGSLARLERELAQANARLDGLVAEKESAGSPRGQRSRELSAEIVKASQEIAALERQRRAAQADLRTLRAALDERYTRVIDSNLERLGTLPQADPAYGDLFIETGRYVKARDSLRVQIRIQESLQDFREYPILPTDGPAEIREKAGFYRDYVNDVAKKIAAIDRRIEEIRDRERVQRRMQEFQEDLVFQGEDVPNRPGATLGDLREEAAIGETPGAPELFAKPPEQVVAELTEERRQLELLRQGFVAKVRDYEQRARTIYSRQSTPTGEENR